MVNEIKILLIEDDRELCAKYLDYMRDRGKNFSLQIAHDCNEAIPVIEEFNPNVVLLDLEINSCYAISFDFLATVKEAGLKVNPLIIAIVDGLSRKIQNYATYYGADYILKKDEMYYSVSNVIGCARLVHDIFN